MAESATTEPIERSISPAQSVKVIPIAITEIMVVCCVMFIRLPPVKKPLLKSVIEKKANMTAKPM